MIIIIFFSISELTFLVKSFTRFSEEIFTGVVALFFTVEAFRTIVKVYIVQWNLRTKDTLGPV